MNKEAKNLTELRRQEQSIHGYSNSSPWYTGLSNAIRFVERAEENDDPLGRFGDAWSAAYNLFMLYGKVGDEEYKRFNKWVTDVKDIPRVRRLFDTALNLLPMAVFLERVEKAKKMLLKPQGQQELDEWLKSSKSPDKLCRYFLTMVRDIRNTCSHPKFNPNSAAVKNALIATSECLIPLIVAATRSIIENPLEGTTGRNTAYRSFLYPFLRNSDSFFSDYYLERIFPNDELGLFPEDQVVPLLKAFAKQMNSNRTKLVTAPPEQVAKDWCVPVLFQTLNYQALSGVRIITGERTFNPTFILEKSSAKGSRKKEYHGKEASKFLVCLIWVLGWNEGLDTIGTDPEFPHLPCTEVAHRAMAESDIQWALVTNGRKVRLLSRGSSHKPRCFLSVDLEAIVDRQGDEDTLRAFRYFLGLFSGNAFVEMDERDRTLLNRVVEGSEQHGKEIGDELKQNVFNALEELGEGFLHYFRSNQDKLEVLRKEKSPSTAAGAFLNSEVLLIEVYQESLSLMYRLLFLFYAESRNLLPMEDETYRDSYSLESIRDDIISIHDDPDPKRFFGKGDTDFWDRLKELFDFVNQGWRKVIPVYNGGLFNPEFHNFLERFKIPDYYLAKAIDYLSRTQPRSNQARGEGRKKLTYRDLDVRHLGSIYEGILEYSAHIAKEDLVVMKRGTGAKSYEEYVSVSDLNQKEKGQLRAWESAVDENLDNPKLPTGCKVIGKKEKGQYFLVFGGRESKRKSSGSYYTPDYIVQYIVENTLGQLVRGECRPDTKPLLTEHKKRGNEGGIPLAGPLSSTEILELKVLDPAMGSGHFLVAATEYLARAYGEALAREGKFIATKAIEEEYIRHKRIIAERCIYGVDINPMAVELAKLSMWLFTMDMGRPLSFLNHHLKCGNSLIGAWIKELAQEPELNSSKKLFKRKKEKPIAVIPAMMKSMGLNPDSSKDVQIYKAKFSQRQQANLFEYHFKEKLPMMIKDLFSIIDKETLSYADIKSKRALDRAIESIKTPFKNIADAWISIFFNKNKINYAALLSNLSSTQSQKFGVGNKLSSFHWELEFPEVWFDKFGRMLENCGFDAVIGNPPYDVLEKERRGEEKPHEKLLHFIKNNLFYNECLGGKINLYRPFLLLSVNILKLGGIFCNIIPMSFMGDSSLTQLRKNIFKKRTISWITAFPQKDNAYQRVFKEAKLSTCIVNIINKCSKKDRNFIVRVYPGNSLNDVPIISKLSYNDIELIDSETMPIPIARQIEIDLAIKIHKKSNTLKNIAEINRGEINQTIFRKYISSNAKDRPLIKGVEIKLFGFNETLSQGEREFFDEKLYENEKRAKKPPSIRIANQRITGVDEYRRLRSALTNNVAYYADSTNSIRAEGIKKMKFILGLVNSNILNWRFSITSTNNNVSTKELSALPVPKEISQKFFDHVINLVDILINKSQKANFNISQSKEYKELNLVFYKYYELTQDEINIFNNRNSI